MRKLPGRIVGQTHDTEGKTGYVLTLSAREQHIRREKASSNICSNEQLCALTAAVYLAAMGEAGLRQAAALCTSRAHYFAQQLEEVLGWKRVYPANSSTSLSLPAHAPSGRWKCWRRTGFWAACPGGGRNSLVRDGADR